MNSLIKNSKKMAVYGISAGFLAASTLSYAQEANVPASDPQQQTANAPDGGWPHAGAPADQSNGPRGSSASPYGQVPPPSQSPTPPVSQQQQPYDQQAPYGQAPYGQQQQPYGPQQPYGRGVYNQQAPPPMPAQIDVPAGTYVTARLNSRLASDRNHPGDAFTATLVEPVVVNGVVVAEPGQTITGQVQEAQKVDGAGRLAVQLTDLPLVDGQRIPIQTQLIARKGDRFRGSDAGIVAGSTAAGAIIGGAADWGRGAAIGAGAGALISLGAILTHGHASVLYPEEVLTFRMQQPITILTTAAPQAFRYVEPGEYNAPRQGPNMQAGGYPAPPPTYYAYGYPAFGYEYGYGYPYYGGPSVGLYFGGPRYYYGYYGRGYYGGYGGHYGGGFHGRR